MCVSPYVYTYDEPHTFKYCLIKYVLMQDAWTMCHKFHNIYSLIFPYFIITHYAKIPWNTKLPLVNTKHNSFNLHYIFQQNLCDLTVCCEDWRSNDHGLQSTANIEMRLLPHIKWCATYLKLNVFTNDTRLNKTLPLNTILLQPRAYFTFKQHWIYG